MTRILSGSLLLAGLLVATLATPSEACHRSRATAAATCDCTGYNNGGYTTTASSMGYYDGTTAGYGTAGGGYNYGGTVGYSGGYDFGRPGYNPGGLGGPQSRIGVRPGMGAGGLGRGR